MREVLTEEAEVLVEREVVAGNEAQQEARKASRQLNADKNVKQLKNRNQTHNQERKLQNGETG